MRRPTRLVGTAVAGVVLALAGCGDEPNYGAPDPVTESGRDVIDLWQGTVITGLVVGAVVWTLIAFSLIRFRRRNDDLPSQTPENIPVEIAYTLAPLAIVAVLFGITVVTQERVTALSSDPDVVVHVTGFQWSWAFDYPDLGVSVEPNGTDPPELVVPVGSTVRFELETSDVNHSFWVPEFLVKRDLIRGIDNQIDVEVTEAGTWRGRCAEFCGLDHWKMAFDVRAVPEAEFDDWVAEQRQEAA